MSEFFHYAVNYSFPMGLLSLLFLYTMFRYSRLLKNRISNIEVTYAAAEAHSQPLQRFKRIRHTILKLSMIPMTSFVLCAIVSGIGYFVYDQVASTSITFQATSIIACIVSLGAAIASVAIAFYRRSKSSFSIELNGKTIRISSDETEKHIAESLESAMESRNG